MRGGARLLCGSRGLNVIYRPHHRYPHRSDDRTRGRRPVAASDTFTHPNPSEDPSRRLVLTQETLSHPSQAPVARRPQSLSYINGYAVPGEKATGLRPTAPAPLSQQVETEVPLSTLPAWVAYDRKVCPPHFCSRLMCLLPSIDLSREPVLTPRARGSSVRASAAGLRADDMLVRWWCEAAVNGHAGAWTSFARVQFGGHSPDRVAHYNRIGGV